MKSIPTLLIVCILLTACTGLNQFPATSTDYAKDLKILDPNYADALKGISATTVAVKKISIRNEEIDRRMSVIDTNFKHFQASLAKEDVRADFGVALVQIGVGGAGALVSETASQILSAVSGGLAGAQQAYDKSALFDKALPALLAQMIASRNALLTTIYQKRSMDIDQYPLSAAKQDMDAYEFAGSIPGAIVATSADASVKNTAAKQEIINEIAKFTKVRDKQHVEATRKQRIGNMIDVINTLPDKTVLQLAQTPPVEDDDIKNGISKMFPAGLTLTASSARKILKFSVVMSGRSDVQLKTWEAALEANKP